MLHSCSWLWVVLFFLCAVVWPLDVRADWAPAYEGPCDETAWVGRECSTESVGYGLCETTSCDDVDGGIQVDAGGDNLCFICVETDSPGGDRGCSMSGGELPVAGSFALSLMPLLVVAAIWRLRRRK